jgi:hypothetical protein
MNPLTITDLTEPLRGKAHNNKKIERMNGEIAENR